MKSFSEIQELNITNKNYRTHVNSSNIVDLSLNKNRDKSSNIVIINDFRDEGNEFLKSIFRDFRKSPSERIKDKTFTKILKPDNITTNNKKTTTEQTPKNNIIEFQDEFPENTLENYPKEDLYKRFLYITFGIIIFFLIFSSKYIITEILQIPSFCDLRKDWIQFDLEVKNKTIVQLYDRTCQDKCTFTNYLISKVLQFDHFIPSFLSNLVYFKNSNLLNKKIVIIYLILFPVLLNLLKFIVFFQDKIRSYLFYTIINVLGYIIFLFDSKKLFFSNLAIGIPLIYFSLIRLLFEFLFIRIYIQNPLRKEIYLL